MLNKAYGRTFVAEDTVSNGHCFIARRVKQAILERLTELISMTFIARVKHVSQNTVVRALRTFETKTVTSTDTFPEVQFFDEFKSVKRVADAMSFIMTGKLIN